MLNGSPTFSSPASPSRGANSPDFNRVIASSIAARRSGVSSRCPFGAAKTTFSTAPCSDVNSDSSRSVAFCVSDPGISNSSLSEPPTAPTRTISTTRIPTQPATTRHGWVAHARAQRASAPVERRSWAARRSADRSSSDAIAPLPLTPSSRWLMLCLVRVSSVTGRRSLRHRRGPRRDSRLGDADGGSRQRPGSRTGPRYGWYACASWAGRTARYGHHPNGHCAWPQ